MELKEYMEKFNVSASAIADGAGVTVQAVSQYCLKKRKPRPEIALKIVAATKGEVSLSDLYTTEQIKEAA